MVWITGSILLFLFDSSSPGLFSWQAIVFIVVGMFAAAIVVGNITYFIVRRVSKSLMKNLNGSSEFELVDAKARRLGYLLLFANLALAVLFLLWTYNSFFWM